MDVLDGAPGPAEPQAEAQQAQDTAGLNPADIMAPEQAPAGEGLPLEACPPRPATDRRCPPGASASCDRLGCGLPERAVGPSGRPRRAAAAIIAPQLLLLLPSPAAHAR